MAASNSCHAAGCRCEAQGVRSRHAAAHAVPRRVCADLHAARVCVGSAQVDRGKLCEGRVHQLRAGTCLPSRARRARLCGRLMMLVRRKKRAFTAPPFILGCCLQSRHMLCCCRCRAHSRATKGVAVSNEPLLALWEGARRGPATIVPVVVCQ